MRPIGTMLLLFTAALTLVAQKSAEHVKTYTPDAIKWGAAPNALPPGAELSVLEGNPMAPGAYTMRLKMPDGYKIPPHHHLRREHVTPFDGNKRSGLLEGHCHCKAITHDLCLSDDVATGSLLPPSSQCPIQLDQAAEFVTSCTCE